MMSQRKRFEKHASALAELVDRGETLRSYLLPKHHCVETVVLFFEICFALKAPSLGIAPTPLSPLDLSTVTTKRLTALVEKAFSPAIGNTGLNEVSWKRDQEFWRNNRDPLVY
jgi:hypothetical protein